MQAAELGRTYQYKNDEITFKITTILGDTAYVKYDDGETGELSIETINDSLGNGDLINTGEVESEEEPVEEEKEEVEEEKEEEAEEEIVTPTSSDRPYRAIDTEKLKANLNAYRKSLASEPDMDFRSK